MDLKILFRIQCMDEVALSELSSSLRNAEKATRTCPLRQPSGWPTNEPLDSLPARKSPARCFLRWPLSSAVPALTPSTLPLRHECGPHTPRQSLRSSSISSNWRPASTILPPVRHSLRQSAVSSVTVTTVRAQAPPWIKKPPPKSLQTSG